MTLKITITGQELELLDDNQLAIVYNKTKKVDDWILNTFFPNKVAFDGKDSVPLDMLETAQPLAPFVSPVAQGKVLKEKGEFKRGYIPAPYLKPAKMVTPTNVRDLALFGKLKDAGIVRGDMGKVDKWRLAQIASFNELRTSIINRKILMACDVLTKGKTLAVGDDHEAMEIDFGRDVNLTFTPLKKWSEKDATIVQDIETMNGLLVEYGNASATAIVTSSKTFLNMVNNDEFKARFIAPKGSTAPNPFDLGLNNPIAVKYRGEFDGINVYTYDATHTLNGEVERFIDETGFYLISDMAGFQAQCMIKHMKNPDELAHEFFDYSIEQNDPSGLKMICESSPLPVPSNVNGVCGGVGFI